VKVERRDNGSLAWNLENDPAHKIMTPKEESSEQEASFEVEEKVNAEAKENAGESKEKNKKEAEQRVKKEVEKQAVEESEAAQKPLPQPTEEQKEEETGESQQAEGSTDESEVDEVKDEIQQGQSSQQEQSSQQDTAAAQKQSDMVEQIMKRHREETKQIMDTLEETKQINKEFKRTNEELSNKVKKMAKELVKMQGIVDQKIKVLSTKIKTFVKKTEKQFEEQWDTHSEQIAECKAGEKKEIKFTIDKVPTVTEKQTDVKEYYRLKIEEKILLKGRNPNDYKIVVDLVDPKNTRRRRRLPASINQDAEVRIVVTKKRGHPQNPFDALKDELNIKDNSSKSTGSVISSTSSATNENKGRWFNVAVCLWILGTVVSVLSRMDGILSRRKRRTCWNLWGLLS